jgi:hypothetical protein
LTPGYWYDVIDLGETVKHGSAVNESAYYLFLRNCTTPTEDDVKEQRFPVEQWQGIARTGFEKWYIHDSRTTYAELLAKLNEYLETYGDPTKYPLGYPTFVECPPLAP